MKAHRKTKLVIGVVFVLAVIGIVSVKMYLSIKENKAVVAAQEYLSDKYTQEMNYNGVSYSWIDPSQYHVTFSPNNMPDMTFEVLVQSDFKLEERTNEYGLFVPDNYLLQRFNEYTYGLYQSVAEDFWDTDVRVNIPINDQPLYAYKIPAEINEQTNEKEMEHFISYYISVDIEHQLSKKSVPLEAEKMLGMINKIKALSATPTKILFWYKTGQDEKAKVVTDSKTWPEMYICFENWADINSSEQVIDQINTQWDFK